MSPPRPKMRRANIAPRARHALQSRLSQRSRRRIDLACENAGPKRIAAQNISRNIRGERNETPRTTQKARRVGCHFLPQALECGSPTKHEEPA